MRLSEEENIPIIATNDSHYIKREHAKAQEILLCINSGKDLSDPNRLTFLTDELYFKSEEEMREIFKEIPEAITNTVKVSEKCNLLLNFGKHYLPSSPLPAGETSNDDYLEKLANEGLKERFSDITPALQKRIDHELSVIRKMGFSSYFLIVKDLIDYARKNEIPVGPGRGSSAGSLVSYALGITNLDPMKFNLIFERFLNPERITMPDIDIDFCYERRNEVINYVIEKYGKGNVAQIITFGSMNARAVVRDVGRVMGLPYGEVDKLAKFIPGSLGITLDKAIKMVPELKEIAEGKGVYAELIKHARILEGMARHASTHAAGVVIAPSPLTDYLPLYRHAQNGKSKNDEKTDQISSGEITTQFTMKYVEEIGLLKMDFLGLRTLTVINNSVREINKEGNTLDIDKIPLNDKVTYKLFSRGETIGIFQFESGGMRDYMKKLKPECLDDLIAMNALYRPGPMDMIDDFIHRKHGIKKIKYLHPKLEPILKETYGITVYQEQVIRISSELGGFSMGKGDQLRRAMGKKNVDVMQAQREEFIKGATERKITKNIANEIFDLMYKFAGYGFNKSHAAGYALVAYQTAYLKTHYPEVFMASTISSEMDRSDRVVILIEECKRMGIEILPPDVNESYYDFRVVGGKISFGLGAIKNVGKSAIESIINSRKENRRFSSIFDMCKRVDLRLVNRKVLESLIQVGAMDSLEGTRAQKFHSIEQASIFGQRYQEEKERKQTNIFEMASDENNQSSQEPQLTKVSEEWTKSQALIKEKELLGFYISGHPLLKHETEINAFSKVNTNNINSLENRTSVRLGGIISQVKKIYDKKNQTMAFVTIEDLKGSTEVILFSDAFNKYNELLKNDNMIFITGSISVKDRDNVKIICDEVIPMKEAAKKFTKYIVLQIETNEIEKTTLKKTVKEIEKYAGGCPVYLEVKTNGNEKLILESQKYKVSPTNPLLSNLKKILGDERVLIYG